MGRRAIDVTSFVRDVRAGTSDPDLMRKYGLSRKVLDELFSRLIKAGKLDPSDLMRDVTQAFESTLVVATTCPRCGALLLADSGECSNCLANQVTQLLKDGKKLDSDSTASRPPPKEPVPAPREAPQEVARVNNSGQADEFASDTVIDSGIQEPENEVPIPFQPEVPADNGYPHERRKGQSGSRWTAIAAVVLVVLIIPPAVLVYVGVLDLAGYFGAAAPAPAPEVKARPQYDRPKAGPIPTVTKELQSAPDSGAKGERRDPEIRASASSDTLEPDSKSPEKVPESLVQAQVSKALATERTNKSVKSSDPPEPIVEPASSATLLAKDENGRTVPGANAFDRVRREMASETSGFPTPPKIGEIAHGTEKEIKPALVQAVRHGEVDQATALLDRGADANSVDSEGSSMLLIAARLGNASMAELLLKRGADAKMRDAGGLTALARACETGNGRLIELLLSNDTRKGAAELLEACEKGKINWVKLMLECGADINARNADGGTPLMIAATKGRLELVETLLHKGADANAQDDKGFTALAWAYSPTAMNVTPFRVQKEIIRLLKHSGTGRPFGTRGN